MMTRILFLLSLVLGSTILLTGAWTGSLSNPPQQAEPAFVPQALPLEADIIGSGVDARQLLQKALEKLDPQRTAWLKTKIRQTMTDADSNFVAEGFLQRGPNHCAHLEMDIVTGGKQGRLLIVSDGEIIAQVSEVPGADPTTDVANFPNAVEGSPSKKLAVKEKFLCGKSCGGPGALLELLQPHLQNARLQTGILHKTPVIQIKGDLNANWASANVGTKTPVQQACVYLDAKTLWPQRIEWWGVDMTNSPRRVLCIEFLEPEFLRELSIDECVRMFSYKPSHEPID